MTKEQVIKAINECDVLRIKLIGKLELLGEQEAESKKVEEVKKEEVINDVKENAEATGL